MFINVIGISSSDKKKSPTSCSIHRARLISLRTFGAMTIPKCFSVQLLFCNIFIYLHNIQNSLFRFNFNLRTNIKIKMRFFFTLEQDKNTFNNIYKHKTSIASNSYDKLTLVSLTIYIYNLFIFVLNLTLISIEIFFCMPVFAMFNPFLQSYT